MERRRKEALEARRQEEIRLREQRLMERLKKTDAAMALLKKWIRQKQAVGRIRGKYAYLIGKVKTIQKAFRRYL